MSTSRVAGSASGTTTVRSRSRTARRDDPAAGSGTALRREDGEAAPHILAAETPVENGEAPPPPESLTNKSEPPKTPPKKDEKKKDEDVIDAEYEVKE